MGKMGTEFRALPDLVKRPLGVTVLGIVCFTFVASLAVRIVLMRDTQLWPTAKLVLYLLFYLVLGIGLLRLARWAWVVSLVAAFARALVTAYSAWFDYSVRTTFPFMWEFELASAILYLGIVIYLLDGHVRRSFWRGPRSEAGQEPNRVTTKGAQTG